MELADRVSGPLDTTEPWSRATFRGMALRASTVAALLLAAAAGPSCQREDSSKAGPGGSPAAASAAATSAAGAAPGAARLELFVMSQCPYGVQVVNAAAEAKKQLGAAMNIDIRYIGEGTPGQLASMHGPAEVVGDVAQVCAAKQAPDRVLAMITCQNENPRAVDKNWRECAQKVGIDVAPLAQCVEGEEGQKLLAASFDESKKRGAEGSPTMFLDGKPYEGGRKPRDFMRAACASIQGAKPAPCGSIPQPPRVGAIFFSDARCKECDIAPLEPRLKSELGGLVVEHIDYASDRGKALYKELVAAGNDFKYLPTVLLGPEVEKDAEGHEALKRFIRPAGKYLELRVGGQWDPTAEICDNSTDDDGDGLADCRDDGCKGFLGCRPTEAKKLDLFVMSQCPYGAKAMIGAQQFVEHFGKDVALDVHFIGEDSGGELKSMHGPAEVEEDVRESCAVKHYGKDHQFMRYLACRSRDYKNGEWKACATEAGMDPAVLQKCYDGDGKKLLAQSFAFAESLRIGSSPTFLVNNRRDFNAITAGQIQTEYCKDNPELAGCKNPIADAAGSEPGAAQAAGGQGAQCN